MSYLCQKCHTPTSFQRESVWKTTLILKNWRTIQYDLMGFLVKNIEGESMEANDFSHILQKWVCCVNNSNCYQRFFF